MDEGACLGTGERRIHPRLGLGLCGYYRAMCPRSEGLAMTDLRAVSVGDLSAGGAFLAGAPYLQVGALLELYVLLPDGGPMLVAHGRVCRCDLHREGGYGVRFAPLAFEDERRLKALVTRLGVMSLAPRSWQPPG